MKNETIIIGGTKNQPKEKPFAFQQNQGEEMGAIVKNKVIVNSKMTEDCKLGKYTIKEIIDALTAHGITI